MNTITLTIVAQSGKELLQMISDLAGNPAKILAANGADHTNGNGHTNGKAPAPVKKLPEPEVINATNGIEKASVDATSSIEKTLTVEAVRAAVQEKSKIKKTEIKALLDSFGAQSVTALDKANYAAFMEKLGQL